MECGIGVLASVCENDVPVYIYPGVKWSEAEVNGGEGRVRANGPSEAGLGGYVMSWDERQQ